MLLSLCVCVCVLTYLLSMPNGPCIDTSSLVIKKGKTPLILHCYITYINQFAQWHFYSTAEQRPPRNHGKNKRLCFDRAMRCNWGIVHQLAVQKTCCVYGSYGLSGSMLSPERCSLSSPCSVFGRFSLSQHQFNSTFTVKSLYLWTLWFKYGGMKEQTAPFTFKRQINILYEHHTVTHLKGAENFVRQHHRHWPASSVQISE